MREREIHSFIKKVAPDVKLNIVWISNSLANKVFKNNTDFHLGINVKSRSLFINKDFWRNSYNDDINKKAYLLHEIGHMVLKNKKYSLVEEELTAQLWAILKSIQIGQPKLEQATFSHLFLWNCKTNYDSKYHRKYAIAGRMASKYGVAELIRKYKIKCE